MSSTFRGAAPPAPQRRMIVHRVTTSETEEFCCVSVAPFGQWIHWFGRRSHECTQDRARCKGCQDNWPVKWKGYLHVLTDCGKTHAFLEITSTCFHLLEAQLPDKTNWRGIRFRLRRTKGGAKGRYLVEVLERRIPDEELPQEQDPLGTLRMLWRAKKGPGQEG